MGISTKSNILLLLGALFLIVKILVPLFKAFFNPLNKVPGPWYARFTRLRLKAAVISGQRMYYVDAMHRRYGPVVRVSPTEVAVSGVEAFQEIHKLGAGFEKTQWYQDLTGFDREVLFSTRESKAHAFKRKLLARGFSKSYLRGTWEGLVRGKVELTVRKMKEEGKAGAAVDIFKWWTLLATDVSSHLMFGNSFEMIEKGKTDLYIETLQAKLKGDGINAELPWVYRLGSLIPTKTCQKLFRSSGFLFDYAARAIQGSRNRGDSTNIFAKVIAEAGKGEIIDDKGVVLEATGLIIAGSDTTGSTLTYLIWAILSRPELRHALEQELSTLPEHYADQELESLPLLNAVIHETLRLYGAAPGALPRASPPQGATLGGYFIPGGTTVSTQAYTIHRDEGIFAHAALFDPYRWLKTDAERPASEGSLAKVAYHPFGAGSRICLGIHLANMELRLATAEFFRQCTEARLAASTTEQTMEMENYFLIAPKSHRCEIVLR